jgi:hypothetical protein
MIFPRVTASVQGYEAKNERPITIKEFSELFITSNDKSGPLHLKPFDRRQLLLKASELKLRDRVFFRKATLEMKNLDVAHAWYTFLKTNEIGDFSPQSDPETTTKGEATACGMVKTHIFIQRFFLEEWYSSYKPPHVTPQKWCELYELKRKERNPHKGEIQLRIEHKRLYELYKDFVRHLFSSSKVRDITTFYDQLAEVGIVRLDKRVNVNGLKRECVDIYFKSWKDKMLVLYPGIPISEWDHSEDFSGFETGFKKWNDNYKFGV